VFVCRCRIYRVLFCISMDFLILCFVYVRVFYYVVVCVLWVL